MNHNQAFERSNRTVPRERFSGGYVSHGRIETMEGKRPWWSLGWRK